APAIAATVLAFVLVGRVRPWAWPEQAALLLVAAAVPVLAVAGVARRVPPGVAARAADRGLETGDAFATALELDAGRLPDGPLADRVRRRAAALAAGRRAGDAVRFRLEGRR